MKRSPLSLAFDFLGRHKWAFAVAIGTRSAWELSAMQVPLLAGLVVDGLHGGPVTAFGFDLGTPQPPILLASAFLGLLAVAVVHGLSAYAYTVTGTNLGQTFVRDLRVRVAEHMASLSLSQQADFGPGELLDRSLTDAERLRQFLDQVFIRTCTNIVRVGYPVVMLFAISPKLAVLALSVIPVQWAIVSFLQRRIQQASRQASTANSALTNVVKENVDGAETVQMLHGEQLRLDVTRRTIDDLERQKRRVNVLTAGVRATVWTMTGLGVATVWWQGGHAVAAGTMTVGMLVVFTGFVEFAYRPFRFFPKVVKTFEEGRASLARIAELLDTEPLVAEVAGAQPLGVVDGRITLEDVSLSYDGRTALDGVDLEFEPRSFTALVGPSGSGKSSLLRLLSRLRDPDVGSVRIDGQRVDEVTLASLRSAVATVPQSPVIFSGTIRENLRIAAPEAAEEALWEACRRADCDFIADLDGGLDARVGHGGATLSGGQAQRLAIARALLRDPRVLLLDEPTSALDGRCQDRIVAALRRLRDEVTVVVVGHRVETFRHADHIVVLEAGRVVDGGTHEELLLRSAAYSDLISSEWSRHVGHVS